MTLSESLILFALGHVEVRLCLFAGHGDVPFRGFVSRLEDDLHFRFQQVLEAIMDSFVQVAKTLGEASISGPLPLAQILPGLGVLDNRAHSSTLSRFRGKAMAIAGGVRQSFSRANLLACVERRGIIAACGATIANLVAVPRGSNADAGGTLLFGGWWLRSFSSPQLSA